MLNPVTHSSATSHVSIEDRGTRLQEELKLAKEVLTPLNDIFKNNDIFIIVAAHCHLPAINNDRLEILKKHIHETLNALIRTVKPNESQQLHELISYFTNFIIYLRTRGDTELRHCLYELCKKESRNEHLFSGYEKLNLLSPDASAKQIIEHISKDNIHPNVLRFFIKK